MSYWHTSYLNKWQSDYYKGVMTVNNVVSPKMAKTILGDKKYGREIEIINDSGLSDVYFADEKINKELPIKIRPKGYIDIDYQQKVYRWITAYDSVKFVDEKNHTYREWINLFADYAHSRPDYWLLAKIITTVAYFDKINARIISKASFGKDSLVNIMDLLIGDTSKIVNPTIAKLKYRLINKVIVLNETGGLKKEDANRLGQFLLAVGAFDPKWENDTRAKNGTKEVYPIERNSFLIFHNIKSYYDDKGMAYFDDQFTPAVQDRFKGLYFEGMVTENFSEVPKQNDDFNNQLIKMIRSAKWFKANPAYTRKYKQNIDFEYTHLEQQRCKRNFDTITKWMDRYSRTQEEYDELCKTLKEAKYHG